MQTKTLGLIGCGGISSAHLSAAEELGGRVRFAAVLDPDEGRRLAVAQRSGGKAFASLEALTDDGVWAELDGLVVCTPPSARLAIIEAAVEHRLPVLAEKPLAHRLVDAERLVEIAEANPDLPLAVAYCHRLVPAVLRIRRMIDEGVLGSLVRFENVFASWNPTMQQHWMSDPSLSGGGSLIDTGCHSLDLFLFLVGSAWVEGVVLRRGWPGRGESNATLLVRHEATRQAGEGEGEGAVAGVIASGWAETPRFQLSVIGTAGAAHYDYEQPTTLRLADQSGRVTTVEVESHELRFARQLEAFCGMIDDPARRGELASFDEALQTARVIDAAYQRAGAERELAAWPA